MKLPWMLVKHEAPPAKMPGFPVDPAGSTPGMGMAGTMFCPLIKGICLKNACMMWAELTYGAGTETERRVGHCTFYWQTIVQTEQTDQIKRLIAALSQMTQPVKQEPSP